MSLSHSDSAARLAALRSLLTKHSLNAYIVDSGDAHANEYVAASDDRRAFISGFTGSAGTAIVLQEKAFLWTDGRYHQQATQQLSPSWTLQPHGTLSVPSWTEWLSTPSHSSSLLPRGSRVGLDPSLITIADYTTLSPALAAAGVELVPVRENLVDLVWGRERPKRPRNEVEVLGEEFAGEAAKSKIERVRKELGNEEKVWGGDKKGRGKRCWGAVFSQLDEIAWLLNIRGTDVPYNPVVFCHLVLPTLSSSKPTLFIDIDQLPQKTYEYLSHDLGVLIEPYDFLNDFLKGISKVVDEESLILLPSRTSLSTALSLTLPKTLSSTRGPISTLKAIKNPTEVAGFRACHIRDGAALVRYFSWLERELKKGGELREYEAALKLEEFRSQLPHFRGLSFSTISSTGANASVIHYSPSSVSGESAVIDPSKVYLCDSGAQFSDGTTDVTRTLHFGEPTSFEKLAYTRVLQGHIALARAVFPNTVSGYQLDPLARGALWREGLDYAHGTGHGVGCFLNVHEGPMGIGTRVAYNDVKLAENHVLSNEPGYYHDGSFGIRIENLVVVQPAKTAHQFGGVKYLKFETLTMCPISTALLDPSLMSLDELEWLNNYHREVWEKVAPVLREIQDEEALEWLERETKPVQMAL
ncbi:hypothetical protein JCM8547_000238 [Rhodosporidiobolus lusitaniae]